MKVTALILDYDSKENALPVIVAQQFKDAPPQIFDPSDIAHVLDQLAISGNVNDEQMEALKVAVEFFQDMEIVLEWTECKKIIVGDVESV